MWSLAAVNHQDEVPFVALAFAAQPHLSAFKPRDLANVAWAFASVKHRDEMLFVSCARKAERQLSEFNP